MPQPVILLAGSIRWPRESHRHYGRVESRLLLWCRAGEMDITLDDGVHRLAAGDWIFIPWGNRTGYRPAGRRSSETAGVHLAPAWPTSSPLTFTVAHDPVLVDQGPARDAALPGCDGVPRGSFHRHPPLGQLAEYCLWWFHRAREADGARTLGRLLVDEIVRARAADREGLPPSLQRALDAADACPGTPEPVLLCRAAGVSRATLARLFQRHLGTSPSAWVTRRRIYRAAELLRETALPVATVAAEVGYDDPAYFSRVFRREQGVCPRTYRERQAAVS